MSRILQNSAFLVEWCYLRKINFSGRTRESDDGKISELLTRREKFSGIPMSDCAFCNIAPERIIAESPLTFTIRDGFPISPGHTLIISKRHFCSFFEATPEEERELLHALRDAKAQLDYEFSPMGYNIGINDGSAAGQTIPHLHIHLIPRYEGDVEDARGGVRRIIPEKAAYWKK